MRKMHQIDPDGANVAAGVKAGFAAVFVGLLVALGMGLAPPLPDAEAPQVRAQEAPPAEQGHVYFPSQYQLDAKEPSEHVQAF